MKIVSSARINLTQQQRLKEQFPQANFYFYENMDGAKEELNSADVLITYGGDVTDEILSHSNQLKWIQVVSAGIDQMPFDTLQRRGIIVTNARGIHQIQMSEYTMGIILQIARKTIDIYKNQEKKVWDQTIRFNEINNATLGIVGIGSIGEGIAQKAKAFNMRVIGMNTDGRPAKHVDKVYKPDQLITLMTESDYVVVIVPLTNKTVNLIGKEELEAMKETAYLINIARGDVIDEAALIEVLKEKKIAGAAIDVFKEEPLPESHPFWELDNVIITPHLSGKSPFYMDRALNIFIENLGKYINHEISIMKNRIDLNKRY